MQRAIVIGSGTMGGGIAAHLANVGVPVYLLDVTQEVVTASMERLKKSTPPAFFAPEAANLVTIGNLKDHLRWISEGDWIIEAIVENLDVKRELVVQIDKLRKPGSIVSSNTSGLPISHIAAKASPDFKAHFLGTHFFNPPRYMKLLEIIPTAETKPEIVAFISDFASRRLGKGVVLCNDTPNFIANRLGSMAGAMLLDFLLERGYTVEEADITAGPLIGRPKTGIFRLYDLVGLDVASSVASNLYGLIEGDESREVLRSPRIERLRGEQIKRGRLGDKSGQGFYKKGGKEILSMDLDTLEYRERREPQIPSVAEAMKIKDPAKRVAFVLQQDDKAGQLARYIIYNSLAYASRRIPEITDSILNVDNAMCWGFSHDLGPFELWDGLGVQKTIKAMDAAGIKPADWVRNVESFYRDGAYYDAAQKKYVPIPKDPRKIDLKDCPVVRQNKSATLRDIDHDVLCLEFHTKMNTLDDGIRAMFVDAVEELKSDRWVGMVIGNEGTDFSVGANLAGGLDPASLDRAVKGMQDALQMIRFSPKPVVAAPFGRTLAGGMETALACARIVAAAETYMGLVEVGVGLVPGAGGCKEFIRRLVSPPMRRTPDADPLPIVSKAMEGIATAAVSTSAAGPFVDRIVMNRDHLLDEAKDEVLKLAAEGYAPPQRDTRNCFAAGRDVYAALRAGIYNLQQSAYISEHDALIAGKLAYILCGGKLSSPQWVDEQHFLDLEREAFVALCREPKTVARIEHMLSTGKPLRN